MNKNTNALTANRRDQLIRLGSIALLIAMFVLFAAAPAMLSVNAATMDKLMTTVINLISDAAKYVGIVIILWGIFQIILAFRREDSEGISKQITTVVVGGVLTGFGVTAKQLYQSLK
jgi:hypothetical protein